MAAPTVGALGTYRQGSSSTPAFAAPASVVSTSIVVLEFFVDTGATVSALPSGFAHAPGSPLTVSGTSHSIVRLWARNPAGATYTPTLSANVYSAGRTYRADGCIATGDPWDTNSGIGAAAATDATNGTVTPAVSMTTQAADELLWFGGSDWSGGTWTEPSAGGTWTEQQDQGDGVSTVDTKSQAVAGATGSITATCTGSDKRGALLGALMSVAPGGGTTYNQSVSGGITPTGALVRQAGKRLAGTVTPTGALVRSIARALAGAITPAGALTRRTSKAFAGAITPAGAVSSLKAAVRLFSGSITPTGTLTRSTGKTLAGSIAPSGSLRRLTAKAFAGTIAATGTLIKQTAKRFLGAITPSGAVTPSTGPPPVVQNITLTVGAPGSRWLAGPPAGRWTAHSPEGRWSAGPPEG